METTPQEQSALRALDRVRQLREHLPHSPKPTSTQTLTADQRQAIERIQARLRRQPHSVTA